MSGWYDWAAELVEDLRTSGPLDGASESSWRMEDLGRLSSSNDSSVVDTTIWNEQNRDSLLTVLLDEYRHVSRNIPSGMIVVPSFHTLLEWHGVLFIDQGWYKGGVFKFVIHIPVDYPESAPSVYFFNRVFHPLVDDKTGKLDLSPAFPSWKSGRDYIVLVLSYVKKLFYKKELNTYAAAMLKEDFLSYCNECVDESLRLIYVCHPNCPFPFSAWRRPHKDNSPTRKKTSLEVIQGVVKEAVVAANSDDEIRDKAKGVIDWLLDEYIPATVGEGEVAIPN
jgi:ubiquitin-protein ligase